MAATLSCASSLSFAGTFPGAAKCLLISEFKRSSLGSRAWMREESGMRPSRRLTRQKISFAQSLAWSSPTPAVRFGVMAGLTEEVSVETLAHFEELVRTKPSSQISAPLGSPLSTVRLGRFAILQDLALSRSRLDERYLEAVRHRVSSASVSHGATFLCDNSKGCGTKNQASGGTYFSTLEYVFDVSL